MKLTWDTLQEQGLDPEHPMNVDVWTPRTPEEVDQLGKQLSNDSDLEGGTPGDDVRGMVMSMLSKSTITVLLD